MRVELAGARPFLLSLCVLCAGTQSNAQEVSVYQFPGGSWGTIESPREHITDQTHQALWQTIQDNIAMLREQGRLAGRKAAQDIRYGWPTRLATGRPEFVDHYVGNYIDQDTAPNSVRDFNCGTRTYDTAAVNGGHKGTDISLGHRAFYKMDTEQVIVVAAAPGIIVARDDANPDRVCGNLTALFAIPTIRTNVISIRHDDGTVAFYYHLKTGSLTAKAVGDAVAEGEYLAVVGSSGYSSGPHLHFELRTADNAVIDPWQGACNPATPASLWKVQEPHQYKVIVDLMPSKAAPTGANLGTTCTDNVAAMKPAADYPQPDFYVQPDVAHNFIAFFYDFEAGDQFRFRLLRPNGSQFDVSSFSPAAGGRAGFSALSKTIPASEAAGTWTFQFTYNDSTKAVPFHFKVPVPAPGRVYEFYHAGLDHFFRTAAAAEAQSLTPDTGFLPTGDDFFALDRSVTNAGVSPVCRFYGSPNPGPNSHFYTADPAECAALQNIQAQTPVTSPRWNYEETAFAAFLPTGGACPAEAPFPIYRLYNQHAGEVIGGKREDSNHRFTTLSSVYYKMGEQGWRGEGVVMCGEAKP